MLLMMLVLCGDLYDAEHGRAAGQMQRVWATAAKGAHVADARVREALRANMDALVAVGLIAGTLLGATLLSVFFAVQIGALSRASSCS
jgi:hypothetical protein